MLKKKTILILGSGGLLGNALCERLKETYFLIGFSHKNNKNKNIIKTNYNFSSKEISIIKRADIIINCIGENNNKNRMNEINVNILKKIALKINCLKKKKTFIHISTCGIYGSPMNTLISEKYPPTPKTKYSKTKFEGEIVLQNYLSTNVNLIILRPSQILGLKMRNTSLKKLYSYVERNLFFFVNNHHSIFSYIMEKDLALIIDSLIKKNYKTKKIYNVSNYITYKNLVEIIQKSLKQDRYFFSINPIIVRFMIFIFENLIRIKIPINDNSLNSLITKSRFRSVKIKKDINLYKFSNINSKNIRELANG
jgi:nucleoside-diphosphate-sugar epimerase